MQRTEDLEALLAGLPGVGVSEREQLETLAELEEEVQRLRGEGVVREGRRREGLLRVEGVLRAVRRV